MPQDGVRGESLAFQVAAGFRHGFSEQCVTTPSQPFPRAFFIHSVITQLGVQTADGDGGSEDLRLRVLH
jgi:hypothetical protein